MPEEKLPIPKFAAKIKAKYPEYKDINDTTLVEKILAKYPEYADSVEWPPIKKKEPSLVSGVGAAIGGQAGTSAAQSEKQKLTDYIYGLKSTEEKQLAAPTGGITTALKPKPKKTEEAARGKIDAIMYEDSDRWKDPVKSIIDETKNVEKFEDLDVYNKAAELTRNSLAGSGFDAKVLLADSFLGAERGNLTTQMLQNRVAEYDKVAQPFRELQFLHGGNPTDNPELDYTAKDKVYDALIKSYANKNPHFAEQLSAAGVDPNKPDIRLSLGDKTGFVVNEVLNDKDFQDFVAKENPNLYSVVKNISDNLLLDNKPFGVNVVANEISRARQKEGFNNPIVELDNEQFRKETDLIAQSLYRDDPVKMQIYNEEIKPNPDKYIDTPNLLESFAHGASGVYKGIGNSFTAPFKSVPEQIKKGWAAEASHVTADPKGLSKFLSGTGHVLGLVSALGGVTPALGGGGAGFYSGKVAPFLAGTIPFAGDFWQEGVMKYPNSPVKAATSASLNTILYGALSQRIFPAKEVKAAFEKIKPGVANIVENLASGKITREVARREANTLLKRGFDLVGGGIKKSAKISAGLTGITAASRGLDKVLMDDETFAQYHDDDELTDTFKTLFLDNLVLGGMTKYSAMRRGNKIVEESLYEAATNPMRYERIINEMEIKDPTISKENMLSNLRMLVDAKKELDRLWVDPISQRRYLFEAAKEKALTEQRKSMPESNLIRKHDEEIKRGQEIKERILAGEEADKIVTESEQKEIDEADRVNTEIERLTKQNELDNKEYEIKRAALDGRNPDDRLKIARLDQWVKEKNEDYQKNIDKISPPKIDQQREIDMGTEQITEPIELDPNLPEDYKGGEPKVDYAEIQPEKITQPIELDPNLPEGYKLPSETPEAVLEKAVAEGRVKGVYADLVKQGQSEAVLKDVAEQAQNLNTDGTPKNDGREAASMKATVEQFGQEVVDAAIAKFPPQEPAKTTVSDAEALPATNSDAAALRSANSKEQIDAAILKATNSSNINDALQDAENIIGKSLFKSVYYSDPKRFANELADAIEKVVQKTSSAEALPVGDVAGGDKKSLNLPNEKTETTTTTEKHISERPVDETTNVQSTNKQGVTGVVHENAAFTEREQGEKRKKSEPVLEDEYGNDIYWHGSDKKIEGQPKVGRSDTVIKTRMGGIPFKDLWDAFYVTTDKLWAESFSPKRKKVHGVKLKKSAKILDLSGVAAESTHFKNKAFLGGNNIKSELPFQKEFEEYGFGWLNKERAKNGAAPLTKEQYLERGFDKGFNPTKEEWWLDEYGQDALVDFIKENGYDAIKFGREIAILNKDIAKFVEQEQPTNVGDVADAAKPPEPPAEPPQATPKAEVGEGQRPPGEPVKPKDVTGGEIAQGITHAANEVRRRDRKLAEYQRQPETFEQWNNEAEQKLKDGYDVDKLMDRIEAGHDPTPVENAIRKIYVATLDAEILKNPTDELLARQKRFIEVGDLANSRAGRNLASLKGVGSPLESISDFYVARMEALGSNKLTEQQKRETQQVFEAVQKADANAEKVLQEYAEEIAKLKAENEILRQRKAAGKPAKPKTSEDFKKERQSYREELKKAREKHEQWLKDQNIKKAGGGFTLTTEMAKIIAKIAKSYVDEGIVKLEDVIQKALDEIKDIFPEVDAKDIRDVLAGEYNETKPTRDELAAKWRDLKDEAYYINKLEKLLSGEEPTKEKEKIKRNQRITELQDKIAAFRRSEREAGKFYGDEAPLDYKKLEALRKKNEAEAEKTRERIKAGDFAPKKPVPFLEDPELQKKFPQKYKEVLDAIHKREEARHEFDIALLKDQMSKRTFFKKYGIDLTGDIIGTTKALVTGIDASGIGIQNLVAMISHPRSAAIALPKSFTDFVSAQNQQRWLASVHSSKLYPLAEKAGLDITEPQALRASKAEDEFTHNLLDRAIKYKGKKYVISKYITKPFERIFVGLGNRMRWNLWQRGVEKLQEQGYTWENHPEEYISLAKVLNTETGRGKLHPQVDKAFNLVSAGIWSPRLMASRMNILGIGDLGNLILGGKRGYYGGLTPKMRVYALGDLAKFVVFGTTFMGLAGLTFADDVDLDPNSSTFGTFLVDGKRYNIWGGFTQYVRLIATYIAGGEKKSDGKFATTDPLTKSLRFLWSKTTPAVGTGISLMRKGQRDYMGQPVTPMGALENLTIPLSVRGIYKGIKEEGGGSILWTGVPSFIGTNVSYQSDFDDKKTPQTKPERQKPERPKREKRE